MEKAEMIYRKFRIIAIVIFFSLGTLFIAGKAESQNPNILQELPAEYEHMQGMIVAWLP